MQFPELEYDFPFRLIKLEDNNTVAACEAGSGETVLLFVHGLASYMKAWFKLIPFFENNFRCITIDLPGYGKSTGGVHPGTQKYYSDVLKKLIDTLELKNVIGVGHSMGGQVVLSAALEHPGIFKKMVLFAPAGFETFTPEETAWIRKNYTAQTYSLPDETQLRNAYNSNFFRVPADMESMLQDRIKMTGYKNFPQYCEVVANSLHGLVEAPVFARLKEINVPASVIYGANDALIPHPLIHKDHNLKEVAARAVAENNLFELNIINECGHFVPFEKPGESAEIINRFLGMS
ncbi:MAG: alpha/beta hydrolase [Ignavibacteriaceae bacterium]|nr:alpha/beta hydrolase [Ignavibacteriaceae bacterium]